MESITGLDAVTARSICTIAASDSSLMAGIGREELYQDSDNGGG
jgi:hypothetical protein